MNLYDSKGDQHALEEVEYGSNEHGEYWKFSSGLLICKGRLQKIFNIKNQSSSQCFFDDSYGIPFSHNFLDSTSYCVNVHISSTNAIIHVYYVKNISMSWAEFGVSSNIVRENLSSSVEYIAIGRWK